MRRVVVALVVSTVLASCGRASDRAVTRPTAAPTAPSTPTTSAAPCEQFGDRQDAAGDLQLPPARTVALLRNVQVQASACVDEVAFLFASGTPGWSVSAAVGPFAADPSNQPVTVAGEAFLRVRFEPASGWDLTGSGARQIYDGPLSVRPRPPSDVQEVAQVGDFEGVTSWIIGLRTARPFDVVVRGEQLVVRIPRPSPRSTACTLEGSSLRLAYPADWFAEMSDRWACQYFDPSPFVVHPSTDDLRWMVTAQVADTSAAEVLWRLRSAPGSRVDATTTTVAGRSATRADVTMLESGLVPEGWVFRMYVVDAGPRGVTIIGAATPPGPAAMASAAAVDALVRGISEG